MRLTVDNRFQKLTPNNDIDISAYKDALDFAFSEKDIINIAITGTNGSGKSSLVRTYEDKTRKKFSYISVTRFMKEEDSDKQNENYNLEGELLNRIIQDIPAKKIYKSAFKKKENSFEWAYILLGLIISAIVYLAGAIFSKWPIFCVSNGINVDWLLTLLFSVLIGGGIAFFIFMQVNKRIIKRIDMFGAGIEVLSESKFSVFDRYLNEVLYILDCVEDDAIVIEDLDRNGSVHIFEKLREVSRLCNKRRLKDGKNSLKFVFVMKDDLLSGKDRTKFFDFIVPVIPYIDQSNAFEIVYEYTNRLEIQLDKKFLRNLSLYIDDVRVLKNIVNEFKIYHAMLKDTPIDVNKMFAIITYKSLFPEDFAKLQFNKGYVYDYLNLKKDKIDNAIKEIDTKIISLNDSKVKKRNVELLQEIESLIVKKHDLRKLGTAEIILGENKLISEYDLNSIYINPNLESEDVQKSDYYEGLLFLLKQGYIDENYHDYITYFHTNTLTKEDKAFLVALNDNQPYDKYYCIKNPEEVIEYIKTDSYVKEAAANYSLFEVLLTKHDNDSLYQLVEGLKRRNDYQFIKEIFEKTKDKSELVSIISFKWSSYLSDILNDDISDTAYIDMWTKYLLSFCEEENIQLVNMNDALVKYISTRKDYLKNIPGNPGMFMFNLKALSISFVEIDYESSEEKLLEDVYNEGLYELTPSNIEMFIYWQHKADVDCKNTWLSVLSDMDLLYEKIAENKNEAVPMILEMYNGDYRDEENFAIEIINGNLKGLEFTESQIATYISGLKTKISDIDLIENNSNKKYLMQEDAFMYSLKNILGYYKLFDLSSELVEFINGYLEKRIFEDVDSNINELDKFLDSCIECNDIITEKYRVIASQIKEVKETFRIVNLDSEKVSILIDYGIISMNQNNISFIVNNYKDNVSEFILADIKAYVKVKEKNPVSRVEIENILLEKGLSDERKTYLISRLNEKMSIVGRRYSDKVICAFVKEEKFAEELSELYAEKSIYVGDGVSAINENALKNIRYIVAGIEVLPDIMKYLLRNVDSDVGYSLLMNHIDNLSMDKIIEYLGLMGDEEFSKALMPNKSKTIEYTLARKNLLDKMKGNQIEDYQADGNYLRIELPKKKRKIISQ